jgi:hypothetical protein
MPQTSRPQICTAGRGPITEGGAVGKRWPRPGGAAERRRPTGRLQSPHSGGSRPKPGLAAHRGPLSAIALPGAWNAAWPALSRIALPLDAYRCAKRRAWRAMGTPGLISGPYRPVGRRAKGANVSKPSNGLDRQIPCGCRRCERCGTQCETLDVHHRTYENRGTERPDQLEVLCRLCHGIAHGLMRPPNR